MEIAEALPASAYAEAPYVWGGGESRDMSAIRRFVRDVIGLPREHVSLTGYWRRAGDD